MRARARDGGVQGKVGVVSEIRVLRRGGVRIADDVFPGVGIGAGRDRVDVRVGGGGGNVLRARARVHGDDDEDDTLSLGDRALMLLAEACTLEATCIKPNGSPHTGKTAAQKRVRD